MIFKIDENLPNEVAGRLRRAEYECDTIHDEGLGGKSDAIIAGVLRSENRILVTLDVGFANIQQYPPADYAGIIVLRLKSQDRTLVLSVMERLIDQFKSRSPAQSLWIVDESRVRIRRGY